MKVKEKPKYNTVQNIGWMVNIAWKNRRRVLLFCVLTAILEVLLNLTQLYIAPEVLARVEQKSPMWMLLTTIGVFTVALFLINGFKEYVKQNTLFARIDVRSAIIAKVAKKCNMTSYPNTLDADFIKMREKAHLACEGNNQATEHIWQTLTMLLKNIGGLIIYLTILSRIDAVLLLVVIATCFAGFFVSRYTNNWRYARRDEEEQYFQKKYYLRNKSESVELAKDIRIFGLQNWLNELLDQIHNLYLDFSLRCERVEVLADITEVILTVARNGIAYIYLINMALNEGLSVSEFLLYFTAVTTFTTWVMGILQEMSALHKESLDISRLREFLDYPEPFKFENGEEIPAAENYELKLVNVSFRYPGAETDTIHGLNLTVCPGEKLAIVGLNGAGKTTLVKLLCGLIDPTEGAVLLNGKDMLADVKLTNYKDKTAQIVCCHECCDRKRRLLFENAEQPAFFLVRLALHVKHLVSRFGNCLLQLFAVKRSLGDYDSLTLRVRRCHFFHIKLASDAVIHMRFAHAAHHTVDFQSCFDHRFVLPIFIQHP